MFQIWIYNNTNPLDLRKFGNIQVCFGVKLPSRWNQRVVDGWCGGEKKVEGGGGAGDGEVFTNSWFHQTLTPKNVKQRHIHCSNFMFKLMFLNDTQVARSYASSNDVKIRSLLMIEFFLRS